jgi:hypothetical protein
MESEPSDLEIERARLLVKAMSVALGTLAITGEDDHRRKLWDGFYASRADLDRVLPGGGAFPRGDGVAAETPPSGTAP